MKKKLSVLVLATLVFGLTGCGQTKENIVTNRQESVEASTEETQESAESEETLAEADAVSGDKSVSVNTAVPEDAVTTISFDTKVVEDTFKNAEAFVKKQGTQKLSIDYGTVKYKAGERDKKYEAGSIAEEVDSKLAAYSMKKLRMYRNDANGSTMDFTVYTNPGSKQIDKIISTEYCSDGRDVTNFYFKEGKLNYVYEYKDDIYGTTYRDNKIPGKKCYFVNDVLVECYVDDEDAFDSNSSYVLASYDQYDKFIQDNYDQMEMDLVNRAYTTYAAVRDIPGYAQISGYVADEYGGILSNVQMKITSKANDYMQKFTTNGDGYFEISVPVNTDDWYGVSMTYGDFKPVTIDDINIPAGTTEYSLGITYMAAEGENKHDTEYYLLDVTKKPKSSLKENEYQIVMEYNNDKANLMPFAMNLKKGKSDTSMSTVISTDEDSQFKYFVTDQRGGNSDNTMTYEMSTSEAQVKVYGKDGLVASYQVPVNRAGVVWEVFEINGTDIVPVNNYYYAVGKETFFK